MASNIASLQQEKKMSYKVTVEAEGYATEAGPVIKKSMVFIRLLLMKFQYVLIFMKFFAGLLSCQRYYCLYVRQLIFT